MTREEFENKRKKELRGTYLSEQEKVSYLQRLLKPYDGDKVFLLQYLEADGNELHDKFWNCKSSSRFAFELYSWMAADSRYKNFEFEKKLLGIKHGTPPNMDVYFEVENRVIFIESKFSENYLPSIDDVADAYYVDYPDAYDSKRKNKLNSTLTERYQNDENAAQMFSSLVTRTKEILRNASKNKTWMYFKQEITHLVGIALTVRKDKTGYYKNKQLEFYNIYYDFGDVVEECTEQFFKESNDIMQQLLEGYCKSFKYSHLSAQEMVKSRTITNFDPNTLAFESNKTIGEILKEQFKFEF